MYALPHDMLFLGGRRVKPQPRAATGPGPEVALKETCRVAPDGTVPLWPFHRRRLESGGCAETVLEGVDTAIETAIMTYDGEWTSRVRLTVIVSEDGSSSASIERRLSSLDVVGGIRAVPIAREQPPELPFGAAKPANRAYWDNAQREACLADGDQAILVNSNNVVIDGGSASIWWRVGRVLITPPAPLAVAGVARAWILEHADSLGYGCLIAPFAFGELDVAEEVFFSNAFGAFTRCGVAVSCV